MGKRNRIKNNRNKRIDNNINTTAANQTTASSKVNYTRIGLSVGIFGGFLIANAIEGNTFLFGCIGGILGMGIGIILNTINK